MAFNSTLGLQLLDQVKIEQYGDPRTENWLLVKSLWPSIGIWIFYMSIILNAKKIMKNREPMQLKYVLFVYNGALVLLSAYMTYEFFMSSYLANYSLLCQPVDYSTSPLAMRMANASWWFFFSKYIELLDTVFFMLRKKFDQISFLHVYHHSVMILNWWLQIKYVPGGQGFFIALLNSFVHVVMYSYYALSCLGPHMQKYLWWKKWLTKLQLTQFVLIITHTSYNYWTDCNFPDWLNLILISQTSVILLLFLHFYVKAYLKRKTA